jgi:hypothetical protein
LQEASKVIDVIVAPQKIFSSTYTKVEALWSQQSALASYYAETGPQKHKRSSARHGEGYYKRPKGVQEVYQQWLQELDPSRNRAGKCSEGKQRASRYL